MPLLPSWKYQDTSFFQINFRECPTDSLWRSFFLVAASVGPDWGRRAILFLGNRNQQEMRLGEKEKHDDEGERKGRRKSNYSFIWLHLVFSDSERGNVSLHLSIFLSMYICAELNGSPLNETGGKVKLPCARLNYTNDYYRVVMVYMEWDRFHIKSCSREWTRQNKRRKEAIERRKEGEEGKERKLSIGRIGSVAVVVYENWIRGTGMNCRQELHKKASKQGSRLKWRSLLCSSSGSF